MNRWIIPAVLLGLVALLGYGLFTPNKDKDPPSMLLGKAAPTFTLTDLKGQPRDLASYRGKPVVVNFWASWCVPCRQESPLLYKASSQYGQDVQFLGVIYNDQPDTAQKFMNEYGLTYPALRDPDSQTAIKYGIGQVPVTYVLDGTGKVVFYKLGPVEEAEFMTALKKAGAKL